MKKGLIFLLVFWFIVPVFGQETDFAYLDHLLVHNAGKNFHVKSGRWSQEPPRKNDIYEMVRI